LFRITARTVQSRSPGETNPTLKPPTMLYKTLSAAVYGIDANIIQVEVDCSGSKCDQDHFHTVGLPDAAVRESRDRVRAALKNCGYDIPPTHITINLAPADIKKEGSGWVSNRSQLYFWLDWPFSCWFSEAELKLKTWPW
jgi:hypothetical protein